MNVFVTELVKFRTGGQCEIMTEAQKPTKTEDEDDGIPTLTNDELTQLQDQMRKVFHVLSHSIPSEISTGMF